MNALLARGTTVSGYELVGEIAGTVAVLGAAAGAYPKVRVWQARRARWRSDRDGHPARIETDAEGKPIVVEPAKPSLAAAVQRLTDTVSQINARTEQLARNGGLSVADAVHRTEAKVEAVVEKVEEATRLARETRSYLDAFTNAALQDNAELWSALSDMGYDRRGRPDAST